MGITTQGVALFLHLSAVVAFFMAAGFQHVALSVLPRTSGAGLTAWTSALRRQLPVQPFAALVLLVTGAWLVHLERSTGVDWSAGWVGTAITALVVVEGLSGALGSRRIRELAAAADAGDDTAELVQRATDPVLRAVTYVATLGFLGVVFVMTAKPDGAIGWVFPVAGAAVGVAVSRLTQPVGVAAGE